MADSKITALTSIGASTDPANDPLVLVDVSDTSMAATGTTKKVTLNNLLSSSPTATGNFTITGDLTVDTSTFKVDSTNDRVGFGTATPAAKLDVASSNNAFNAIQARYNSSNPLIGFGIANSNGYGYLGFNTKPKSSSDTMTYEMTNSATQLRMDAGQFRFNIAASGTAGNDITFTTAATIDASGNLLVGATSPHLTGRSAFQNNQTGQVTLRNSSATAGRSFYLGMDSGSSIQIANELAVGVYMVYGGTSWIALSDERLKDIIEPISNAVAKVGSLRSVIGKFKTDAEGTRRSFLIAQDVQAVLPEAVDASNPDKIGLSYSEVIPLLVAAIKELTARVQTLEAK